MLPLFTLAPLPFVLWFALSKSGTRWLKSIPLQWLIYAQVIRLLVETGIWLGVHRGMLPVQMSFEGRNFDVLTALAAIPVGYFCFVQPVWPRRVAFWFNIGGLLLLANAVAIAVLSMPTPIRVFHNAPDASALTRFPFLLIPRVFVPLAYALHILSLRQLRVTGATYLPANHGQGRRHANPGNAVPGTGA